MRQTTFELEPVPPFRLDLTIWVLRRRPHNLIDRWDGQTYRRVMMVRDQAVEVAVTQTTPVESPQLSVKASHADSLKDLTKILRPLLVKMLGLDIDLSPFYRLAAADSRLLALTARFRGVKPPRFPTVFEAMVNAIACQQVSLTLGIHLLNRLATNYGSVFEADSEAQHAFPQPENLAALSPDAFRELGYSRNKGKAIIGLAQGLTTGNLDLESLEELNDAEAVNRLLALKGVGRWTAEYALLRALGRWSIFPGDDVGARRHLKNWLKLDEPLNYDGIHRLLARWQPYGGLIYFHFLLNGLAEAGHLA